MDDDAAFLQLQIDLELTHLAKMRDRLDAWGTGKTTTKTRRVLWRKYKQRVNKVQKMSNRLFAMNNGIRLDT